MRILLLTVAVGLLGGCASSGQRKTAAITSPDIPVKAERPSLLQRLKFSQQREAGHAATALTDVRGNVIR
jgi:hypothetical protein